MPRNVLLCHYKRCKTALALGSPDGQVKIPQLKIIFLLMIAYRRLEKQAFSLFHLCSMKIEVGEKKVATTGVLWLALRVDSARFTAAVLALGSIVP